MQQEFNGQGVLVTGGASGLGLAAAQGFAAAGARVVICDLDGAAAEAAAEALGAAGATGPGMVHLGLQGDVASETDVARMVAAAEAHCGGLRVLINSAGIPDSFRPTVEQETAAWQRLIDVHLTGTWMMCRAVAPGMLAVGGGAIVNVSSIAGVLGLTRRNAYSAAKAGIGMLTRVLACEWAQQGVRVNAVAPGYMMTPFFRRLLDEGKLDGARILRRTPAGRFGTPEHIADAMMFLASERAEFITGVVLPVDGGYMAHGAAEDASVQA